ncbi:Hsp70 protein-domain-containing protein [Pisolithus tinctorius]|nr:Hsp70 protein-domain-containing protein [Pisolithus tinctorius]
MTLDHAESSVIAVYDLSSGTFDISILEMHKGVFEVKNSRALTSVKTAWPVTASARLPFTTADATGPKHINLKLNRTQFETLTSPLIQHTIVNPCRKALLDAGVKPSEVNEVILVGGMTRMLKVGETEVDLRSRPRVVFSPEMSLTFYFSTSPTLFSLGIETNLGLQVFSTAADGQTAIEVKIFQGERELVEDNKLLGNFNLVGIPPVPKGISQIENTLDVDADDIVYVTAQGKATNEDQSMMIASSSGLSDKDIKRMISDAEKYADTDKAHQGLIEEANKGESICVDTEKAMNEFKDQLDAAERKVSKLAGELRKLASKGLTSNASVTAEQIKEKISEIQQASLGLFQKVYEKRSTENASSKESTQGSEEKKE